MAWTRTHACFLQVSKISPLRFSIIAPDLFEIDAMVWKYIKKKKQTHNLLYKQINIYIVTCRPFLGNNSVQNTFPYERTFNKHFHG
jgi:hypothetical protein